MSTTATLPIDDTKSETESQNAALPVTSSENLQDHSESYLEDCSAESTVPDAMTPNHRQVYSKDAQTCLIEVINYPSLHSTSVRQKVHAKGEYDAILLVYDVSNRESFKYVQTLNAEMSKIGQHQQRKARYTNRQNSSFKKLLGRATPESIGMEIPIDGRTGERIGEKAVLRKTVIGLVGNKCDVDAYDAIIPAEEDSRERNGASECVVSPATHEQLKLPRPTSCDSLVDWISLKTTKTGNAEPTRPAEVRTGPISSIPNISVSRRREVSESEGESLAQELSLAMPFFEVSAKTGQNVERAFEAIARVALQRSGRAAASGQASAKHFASSHGSGTTKPNEPVPILQNSPSDATLVPTTCEVAPPPVERGKWHNCQLNPIAKQSADKNIQNTDRQVWKWDTIVKRMGEVFTRKRTLVEEAGAVSVQEWSGRTVDVLD